MLLLLGLFEYTISRSYVFVFYTQLTSKADSVHSEQSTLPTTTSQPHGMMAYSTATQDDGLQHSHTG